MVHKKQHKVVSFTENYIIFLMCRCVSVSRTYEESVEKTDVTNVANYTKKYSTFVY